MIASFLSAAAKALVVLLVSAVGTAGSLAHSLPGLPLLPVKVAIQRGGQVHDLVGRLASAAAHERAMAACELGRMRSSRDLRSALEPLIALLEDGTAVEPRLCRDRGWWDGRNEASSPGREAAIALEQLGDVAIDPALRALREDGPTGRENAAFALGLIESSRAVGGLAEALRDEVGAVRSQAAWALGMIEDRAGVEPLLGALAAGDADVREQAAWALGMIEDSRAVEALSKALEDEDAGVRKQALWALMQCIDEDDPDFDYAELAARLRKALRGGGS